MRINTNVSSLTAQEAAQNTSKSITSSLEKLSTGLRINKASDDASGLAIADKLRTQATSLGQGISNGNSAIALLQIADKSMGEQSNILDTIKSKLVQANTDTTSDAGRESIRKDIKKLLTQLDNIATQTNYNGKSLLADVKDGQLTGKAASALNFQIGASNSDIISTAAINSTSSSLGGGDSAIISEIGEGATETLANVESGTLGVKSQGTNALDVNITGNVGTLTAGASGTTDLTLIVNNNDTDTIAKLKDLIVATKFEQGAFDNVFTLKATKSVDLTNIDLSGVQIKAASTANGFTATGSSFQITNNDLANAVDVTSTQDVVKGQTTSVSSIDSNVELDVQSSAAGAVNLTISGNLGTLTTGVAGVKIETTNASDAAALQKLVDDGLGITRSGDEFTFTAAGPFDLSSVNLTDAKLTATAAGAASVIKTTSSDQISITNNATNKLIITGMDVKGGANLEGLKNLEEGGLTQDVASKFQTVVDDAITQLNSYRGDIGSTQNQVESAVRNLQTQQTNIKAAESVIRDVDYAAESANFNKQNIISQAGSYAISQANAVQQNVLRLLQ